MVVAAIVVQLDLTDELDPDSLMLQAVGLPVEGDVDLAGDVFAIVEQVEPLFATVLVFDVGHLALVLAVQDDVDVGILPKVDTKEAL